MGLTPSIPLSTLVREGDVLTPLSSLAGEGVGGGVNTARYPI